MLNLQSKHDEPPRSSSPIHWHVPYDLPNSKSVSAERKYRCMLQGVSLSWWRFLSNRMMSVHRSWFVLNLITNKSRRLGCLNYRVNKENFKVLGLRSEVFCPKKERTILELTVNIKPWIKEQMGLICFICNCLNYDYNHDSQSLFRFVIPQFTTSSLCASFLSQVRMNSTNQTARNALVFIAQ